MYTLNVKFLSVQYAYCIVQVTSSMSFVACHKDIVHFIVSIFIAK